MAGLMKRLNGSTLVEVIVAMVITVTAIGIAFSIMANISKTDNSRLRLNALLRANEVITNTRVSSKYLDENMEEGAMEIYKTVTPYKSSDKLYILKIEVYNRNKHKIFEKQELIPTE